MSKKKSTSKKLERQAKAVSRETKKQASNIAKNVKATGKFIKTVKNAIGGSNKKPKQTVSKEKQPSKVSPKKLVSSKPKTSASKPSQSKSAQPGKRSYKLRDVASGKNLASLFSDLENNTSEIDKLKPSGARWAFQIHGRRSLTVYRSMSQVVEKIGYLGSTEALNPNMASHISFITIGGSPKDYQEKRQMERKQLDESNAKTIREVRKTVGGSKEGRQKTKNELLRDLLASKKKDQAEKRKADARYKASVKRQAETEKRLVEIEKRLAKVLKNAEKTAKRATKKVSSKKSPSKSGVSKTRAKSNDGRNTKKKPAKKQSKKK